MARHDAPHVRQADPGSVELVRAMQALKHSEEFVCVRHVEPDAIVTHVQHALAVHRRQCSHMDLRPLPRFRVLDRVRDQVRECKPQQRTVPLDARKRPDMPFQATASEVTACLDAHVCQEVRQVNVRRPQRGLCRARERQQIVDQSSHVAACLDDPTKVRSALIGQPLAARLIEQIRKPGHVPQRRAQVVGDGRSEGFQLLVDPRKLRRPGDHSRFEVDPCLCEPVLRIVDGAPDDAGSTPHQCRNEPRSPEDGNGGDKRGVRVQTRDQQVSRGACR